MKHLKRLKYSALLGIVLVTFLASCKLNDEPTAALPPVAYVSLYQASPNSPGLNIVVDDKIINNYSFDYADHTGYLRFYTGSRTLKFGPYGANNIVADTTVTFEDGKAYSVFVVDTYQDADVLILDDDADRPASGKAKVRFLNLSPDAPDINLNAAGVENALFTGQSFKEKAEFIEVDAKEYDFQVKLASGNHDILLTIPDARLQDGWNYTVLVRGFQTPPGGSSSVLSAEIVVN